MAERRVQRDEIPGGLEVARSPVGSMTPSQSAESLRGAIPSLEAAGFVDSRLSNDVRAVTDLAFYTTDAYTERSIDWLEKNKSKRWFLYRNRSIWTW